MGYINKVGFRKHGLHPEDDPFPGQLVDVGEAFIQDEELEILEQVPDEVDAVFLTEGELGKALVQAALQAEDRDEFSHPGMPFRGNDLFKVASDRRPPRQPFEVVGIGQAVDPVQGNLAGMAREVP